MNATGKTTVNGWRPVLTVPRRRTAPCRATRSPQPPQGEAIFALQRRPLLATALAAWLPFPSAAEDYRVDQDSLRSAATPDVTHRVALTFGLCAEGSRSRRSLGSVRFCEDVENLGTLTIGLFGSLLPITVANFVETVESGAFEGTIVNRIQPGAYLSVGKQGTRRSGEVEAPPTLQSNPELTSSKAFALRHVRPGTVSLAIAENEDESERTLAPDYHPTQFLVTTGPGPAPQLDNANVVFGRVLEGFDTLGELAEARIYQPSARVQAFNAFARAIGDERAAEARKTWGRPIQPIVLTAAQVERLSLSTAPPVNAT